MADDDSATEPVDVGNITDQVLAKLAEHAGQDVAIDMLAKSMIKALNGLASGLLTALEGISRAGGKALVAAEEPVLPIFAAFVEPIVTKMFGSEMPSGAFSSRDATGARAEGARALVEAYLSAIAGANTGELQPSDEGAKRIAGAAIHASLEGWFNAWILEMLGDCVPWEWLKFRDMTALPEEIIRSLGVGRLVRRAVSPIVDVAAATPLRWKMNRDFRPELLTAAQVIRQGLRGQWDWSDVYEELARLGFNETRISALINENSKFLGLSDAEELTRGGGWSRDDVEKHLRDQGYSQETAFYAVEADRRARLNSIWNRVISPAMSAYTDREITSGDFRNILVAAIPDEEERKLYGDVGDLLLSINVKKLSSTQAAACVKAGILAIEDYRNALRREGYGEDDVLSLELLLRDELAAADEKAQQRQQALDERAAEQKAKADAAAKKLAEVDAQRALQRRGSVTDLTKAVVRGLIPISRLQEVLNAEYDADTVAILTGLAEDDRQKYLAQQQKADDITKAAAVRHVDVGTLNTAVLEGVLSVDDYRKQLGSLNFAPADVDILATVIAAKLADKQQAEQLRRDADAKAKAKSIDLSRFEQLVRRGARPLSDYDALLQSLGYDDASRAAMDELLQLKIADDNKAAATRAAAMSDDPQKGLTLEQTRRAVILGLKQSTDYETYLVNANYSADAVAVLMGELDDDVEQADAARQRRAAADARSANRAIPIADLARAARLGIVDPSAYQARLVADGYSDDDVAIEMDLLTNEIADVQAARQTQAVTDAAAPSRGLTLAQIERAVKAGVKSLDDYRAALITSGLSADSVSTLVRVLGDELAAGKAAKARRDVIAGQLQGSTVAIGVLEDQVRAGAISLDNYVGQLEEAGIATDDAELLASLLADDVGGTGA